MQLTYGNFDVTFAMDYETGRELNEEQRKALRRVLDKKKGVIDSDIESNYREIVLPELPKIVYGPSFYSMKINLDRKKHKAIFGPE